MGNFSIKTLVLGLMQTNCYFFTNKETLETIIIDPADESDKIIEHIEKNNFKPVAVLLTHGHYDHITAANAIKEKYEVNIYCHELEADICESTRQNLSYKMGRVNITVQPDVLMKDREEIVLAGYKIRVMHTPGHTRGSVCYYLYEIDKLFSGDMLFFESIGRTDFETGDFKAMIESLRNKCMALPDQVEVFPGHGIFTSIGHERKHNPYVTEENFWE